MNGQSTPRGSAGFDQTFRSTSPATGRVVWEGRAASEQQVDRAVERAKESNQDWRSTPLKERIEVARRFADLARSGRSELASSIADETGKPRWESNAEAGLVSAKVDVAIAAQQDRCADDAVELPQGTGRVHHWPVGVLAVLGPFNFPAHLPNGHIVPALIAGNSVLFKPSEATPGTGALLVRWWAEAGLPAGVLQVLQGGSSVGQRLVRSDIDGVLFTGSYAAGCAIHRELAGRPQVMLALEMGGNNPIMVHDVADVEAAAKTCVLSAFVTAGQRCTCARRLIVPDGPTAELLIRRVVEVSEAVTVGYPHDDVDPFCGPLISADAGRRVLQTQSEWIDRGGQALLAARSLRENDALLSPGVIDVTTMSDRADTEVFGPLLQVVRVPDVESGLREADATAYGLAAGLLSDDATLFDRFRRSVRAGIVNWNQPTIGASGRLPFGGWGASGNHRPSGYFAADYCNQVAAGIETTRLHWAEGKYPSLEASDREPETQDGDREVGQNPSGGSA